MIDHLSVAGTSVFVIAALRLSVEGAAYAMGPVAPLATPLQGDASRPYRSTNQQGKVSPFACCLTCTTVIPLF